MRKLSTTLQEGIVCRHPLDSTADLHLLLDKKKENPRNMFKKNKVMELCYHVLDDIRCSKCLISRLDRRQPTCRLTILKVGLFLCEIESMYDLR